MDDDDILQSLCDVGRALDAAGMARAGSGNISARLGDGRIAISATGASLGALTPATLALVQPDGPAIPGPPASKEVPLHLALYAARPGAGAVVHLHSPAATAWSIMDGTDPGNALPALTPYAVMRLGRVALVPFEVPGDPALGQHIAARAGTHSAFLLANHGSVVAASTPRAAQLAAEELEEAARLALMLRGHPVRPLTEGQIDAIQSAFGARYQ